MRRLSDGQVVYTAMCTDTGGMLDDGTVSAVRSAQHCLRHRGPDETEQWSDDRAVFGFNRLSFIDIEHSHQPMPYADGRYRIVFNGEIYNYVELREELAAAGATFATDAGLRHGSHGTLLRHGGVAAVTEPDPGQAAPPDAAADPRGFYTAGYSLADRSEADRMGRWRMFLLGHGLLLGVYALLFIPEGGKGVAVAALLLHSDCVLAPRHRRSLN